MQRNDQRDEVHEQMLVLPGGLPDYETHGSLYNQWLDAHHDQSFDRHHSMGGRYTRASFDGDGYLEDLIAAMAADAIAQGYAEQAEQLFFMADEVYWEEQ